MDFVLFVLASFSFILGFLFSFERPVSTSSYLALAYLAWVAWFHLWAAALVFKNIVAAILLPYSAAGPLFPIAMAVIDYASKHLSADPSWYLSASDSFRIIATTVILVSTTALVSIIAMAAKKTQASWFLIALIAVLGVASAWILLDHAMSSTTSRADDFGPPWWPMFWPASLGLAYWIAWRGIHDNTLGDSYLRL